MSSAESKLRMQPKPHQWSPELRIFAFIMRYWKLRLREQRYIEDYTNTFDRWELQLQAYDSEFSFPDKGKLLTAATVRKNLTAATRKFRKVQTESKELREGSYQELLSYYDADNSASKSESRRKAKIVNRTIRSESCRRLYSAIRQIVNPTEYSPLAHIQVPRVIGT